MFRQAFKKSLSSSSSPSLSRTRGLHQRVPLPYSLSSNLSPFLSPKALKTISIDWQQGVLSKLNELTLGTEYEGLSALQTVKATASDPTQSLVFNYASEALNNSFFLSTLSPQPRPLTPSSPLSLRISQTPSFSQGLPSLISSFSAHCTGLHPSSGAYVWLVVDKNGNLGIVGTYAGGSLLVNGREQSGLGAFARRKEDEGRVLGEILPSPDSSNSSSDSSDPSSSPSSPDADWTLTPSSPRRTSTLLDSFSPPSSSSRSGLPSTHLHPLLAISLHPHCYIEDYGIWGRENYVKNWWGRVDWEGVERSYRGFTERLV